MDGHYGKAWCIVRVMVEAGFTLVDARGRKYLTAEERARFL